MCHSATTVLADATPAGSSATVAIVTNPAMDTAIALRANLRM
jgi:hypothetical protein